MRPKEHFETQILGGHQLKDYHYRNGKSAKEMRQNLQTGIN